MQDLHSTGPGRWQRLRRPSTLVMLGAGLLAADPLRFLAAGMDATLPGFVRGAAALVLLVTLGWVVATRPRRRREVEVLVLPPRASRRPGA